MTIPVPPCPLPPKVLEDALKRTGRKIVPYDATINWSNVK